MLLVVPARIFTVELIIGSLGSIPRGLKDQLETLQIYHTNLIPKRPMNSYHILRRFMREHNLLDKV